MKKKFGWFAFLGILISCVSLWAQMQSRRTYIYDETRQLVGVIDEEGNRLSYTYDAAGNMISVERLTARGDVDIFFLEPSRGKAAVPPQKGTPVTIHGVGFSDEPDENQVTFNGVAAVVDSSTTTMIKTTVPEGATTGRVRVTSPLGTAISRSDFIITKECVDPPPSLIGWWPGEGDASDIIGDNPGTLVGGVTFADGMVGQAFSFNGSNAYVEIPNNPNLTPLSSSVTLDAWVKPNVIGGPQVIVSKYSSNFNQSWALSNLDGRIRFGVYQAPTTNRSIDTIGPVLSPGVWQHVAGTFDLATQAIRIYVNGIEIPSTFVPGEDRTITFIRNSSSPVRIGALETGGVRYFWNGLIDEVDIYDRALTAQEIRSIYDAGAAGKCKP